MSENITHTAIVDDCNRLIAWSPTICEPFKRVVAAHPEAARLGGVTRSGDRHNPGLLARYRDAWDASEETNELGWKLAFVIGWLSHRAADRNFKRVFRALDPDCTLSPYDCSVYQDGEVFRRVYHREWPYPPAVVETGMTSHPAASAVDVEQVFDLFASMWQRFLIAIHTFIPDETAPDAWLEAVRQRHQRLRVDLRRYAVACLAPEPEPYRRFVVDCNFYNPADPLLVLVEALRQRAPGAGVAEELADEGPAASLYCRALSRAYRYARAASDYFVGALDDAALAAALDIGQPELLAMDE